VDGADKHSKKNVRIFWEVQFFNFNILLEALFNARNIWSKAFSLTFSHEPIAAEHWLIF